MPGTEKITPSTEKSMPGDEEIMPGDEESMPRPRKVCRGYWEEITPRPTWTGKIMPSTEVICLVLVNFSK
jgi:hypothetical protein